MKHVYRSRAGGLALLAALVAAGCGGGGVNPTATPGPGQSTAPPGAPSPSSLVSTPPTAPPAVGGTTVSVTLTGGASAGSYTGTLDPGCALGFMGENVWSVNFVMLTGSSPGVLSEAIIVSPPAEGGESRLAIEVGIGLLYDTAAGYKSYRIEPERSDFRGTGTVEVTDNGATAVLHATGTTQDGVGIDMTVNCPQVTRG